MHGATASILEEKGAFKLSYCRYFRAARNLWTILEENKTLEWRQLASWMVLPYFRREKNGFESELAPWEEKGVACWMVVALFQKRKEGNLSFENQLPVEW